MEEQPEDSCCWPCKPADPRPEVRQMNTIFWVHLLLFIVPTFGASIAILVTIFVLISIDFHLDKRSVDVDRVPVFFWPIIAVFVLPLIASTWASVRLLWLCCRHRLPTYGLCVAQLIAAIVLVLFRITTVYMVPLDQVYHPSSGFVILLQEVEQLVYVFLFYFALYSARQDLDRKLGSRSDVELSIVAYVDGEPYYLPQQSEHFCIAEPDVIQDKSSF